MKYQKYMPNYEVTQSDPKVLPLEPNLTCGHSNIKRDVLPFICIEEAICLFYMFWFIPEAGEILKGSRKTEEIPLLSSGQKSSLCVERVLKRKNSKG